MRFLKYLEEAVLTTHVEKNLAKGHVDVIGAPKYKKKKRKTKLDRRTYTVYEVKMTVKDLPTMFHKDPLYKAVLMATNKKEYDKALATLKSIRGDAAFRNFVKALKDAEETFNKARKKGDK
jgi:hypothetical protein